MAEIHGRLTGRAGVCSSTLGPGAINLLLGTADANSNSTPLVALSAQVGSQPYLQGIASERRSGGDVHPGHEVGRHGPHCGGVPEMLRKAFKLAQTERPGAVFLAVPEDVEALFVSDDAAPLTVNIPRPTSLRPPRSPAPSPFSTGPVDR